jgi:type IV fimbrial biogenesis protein FimT
MLGSMMRTQESARGFTMIELMVVAALIAVILALAVPSFTGILARKRLEGVASELATDIQYARSEAAQRNVVVGIVFGTTCYVIYVIGDTAATGCAAIGNVATALKTVQISGGTSLTFVPPAPRAFIAFDPVRGMAADTSGATDLSGYVDLINSAGNWQIRAIVTRVGRVKLCSPNGTITALATDCT